MDWCGPQEVRFWCRIFIRQQPEIVAFPWRRGLDILQIDLQLIGDTLRAVGQLSTANIEGVPHYRSGWGRTPTRTQEEEIGSQGGGQQDDDEGNQPEEQSSALSRG